MIPIILKDIPVTIEADIVMDKMRLKDKARYARELEKMLEDAMNSLQTQGGI
jgi:hypothetical protein